MEGNASFLFRSVTYYPQILRTSLNPIQTLYRKNVMHNQCGFKDKRITVMGLGLFGGGVGVARFLTNQGARVTVTDLKGSMELAPSMKQLEGLPISFKLGGHCESDFADADMVIINPAVPRNSKFIQIAQNHDVPLNTEMNLFFQFCPAPIIGITGSNGKSTTTTLTAKILEQTPRKTWMGGNIGKSLLNNLDEIKQDDIVVVELSSFQLAELRNIKKSPHISVLTNLSPNHLDRHGDMDDYIHAKKGIIEHQTSSDYAILNYDDPELRRWKGEYKGRVLWYSARLPLREGVSIKDKSMVIAIDGVSIAVPGLSAVKLPGVHNLQNIFAASCAAYLAGAKGNHIRKEITAFTGLEHRLEFVREVGGVRYFNDSKATTPESAIAAISAFPSPVILIAGGSDKGSSFEAFAEACVKHTRSVILIGKTAQKIKGLIQGKKGTGETPAVSTPETFKDAFTQAHRTAQAGEVVLLSPACASYDMFTNYEDRGRQFKEMAHTL